MLRYRPWIRVVLCIFAYVMLYTTESTARFPEEFRAIDGTQNNLNHPEWGSAGVPLLRLTAIDYADGMEAPAGADRASARSISNAVAKQDGSIPHAARASGFIWQWGQFLDHDLDLTRAAAPPEPFDISVPGSDPFFDPLGTGTEIIPFDRSRSAIVAGVRQQINEITAYIDASHIYGSDAARAESLRTLDGTGRLKTSPGALLPFNEHGFQNHPDDHDPTFFLAGDVRANEQVGLTAMHTLFVREHNRWAARFRRNPDLSDEEVYQQARAIVAAEIQAITYNEFLPALLGRHALSPYTGYKPNVNAGVANVFSTAAFRVGHTMLPPILWRLDRKNQPIAAEHLPLQDAFFAPHEIVAHGIEPLLRGLAHQPAQEVDNRVVDAVRNFLFGPPGAGGVDLVSMNIQRGRDHGLPSYNQVRLDWGLVPANDFADISTDPAVQARLSNAYATVDDIDIWVGGLAEDHVPGALVGETFFTILQDQFERLRDGDRFWYQHDLPPPWIRVVERHTLATIIRLNTSINREIPNNVFLHNTPKRQQR